MYALTFILFNFFFCFNIAWKGCRDAEFVNIQIRIESYYSFCILFFSFSNCLQERWYLTKEEILLKARDDKIFLDPLLLFSVITWLYKFHYVCTRLDGISIWCTHLCDEIIYPCENLSHERCCSTLWSPLLGVKKKLFTNLSKFEHMLLFGSCDPFLPFPMYSQVLSCPCWSWSLQVNLCVCSVRGITNCMFSVDRIVSAV